MKSPNPRLKKYKSYGLPTPKNRISTLFHSRTMKKKQSSVLDIAKESIIETDANNFFLIQTGNHMQKWLSSMIKEYSSPDLLNRKGIKQDHKCEEINPYLNNEGLIWNNINENKGKVRKIPSWTKKKKTISRKQSRLPRNSVDLNNESDNTVVSHLQLLPDVKEEEGANDCPILYGKESGLGLRKIESKSKIIHSPLNVKKKERTNNSFRSEVSSDIMLQHQGNPNIKENELITFNKTPSTCKRVKSMQEHHKKKMSSTLMIEDQRRSKTNIPKDRNFYETKRIGDTKENNNESNISTNKLFCQRHASKYKTENISAQKLTSFFKRVVLHNTKRISSINSQLQLKKHLSYVPQHKEYDIENFNGLSTDNKKELKDLCTELKNTIWSTNSEPSDFTISNNNKEDSPIEFTHSSHTSLPSLQTQKEEKYRKFLHKAEVYDSLDDEEIEDEIPDNFYIPLNSIYLMIFDCLIFIGVTYSILYTPYNWASADYFVETARNKSVPLSIMHYWNSLFVIECIIDSLYIVDIIKSFFVSFSRYDEVIVTDKYSIALNYLTSWFALDFIIATPFNSWISYTHLSNNQIFHIHYTSHEHSPFDLLKLIRVLKIWKVIFDNQFFKICVKQFYKVTHLSRWSKWYVSLFSFVIGIHILTSTFVFIGKTKHPNWITQYQLSDESFVILYLNSLYFILASIYTVGYGDVTCQNINERCFNLILLLFGIMIYSYGLSSISTYIQSNDTKTEEYLKKCSVFEEIRWTHDKMPESLYDKISRFLLYRLKSEKLDKNVIWNSLPIGWRNTWIYEMYKPIITTFVFFKDFNNMDFIVRVILAFKPILAIKNDILVNEGEYIEEIIFVKRGNLWLQLPIPDLDYEIEKHKKSLMSQEHLFAGSNDYARRSTQFYNIAINEDRLIRRDYSNVSAINNNNDINIRLTNTMKIKEKQEENNAMNYVNIWEIRKNEHFGDTLMFLNRRSPWSVKIKTKKAELYFLKKTDAIEISMSYPQIWNKINRKSLFNMEQIDRWIDKAIKMFIVSNKRKVNEILRMQAIKPKRTSSIPKQGIRLKIREYCNKLGEKGIKKWTMKETSSFDLQSIPSNSSYIDDEASIKGNISGNEYNDQSISGELDIGNEWSNKYNIVIHQEKTSSSEGNASPVRWKSNENIFNDISAKNKVQTNRNTCAHVNKRQPKRGDSINSDLITQTEYINVEDEVIQIPLNLSALNNSCDNKPIREVNKMQITITTEGSFTISRTYSNLYAISNYDLFAVNQVIDKSFIPSQKHKTQQLTKNANSIDIEYNPKLHKHWVNWSENSKNKPTSCNTISHSQQSKSLKRINSQNSIHNKKNILSCGPSTSTPLVLPRKINWNKVNLFKDWTDDKDEDDPSKEKDKDKNQSQWAIDHKEDFNQAKSKFINWKMIINDDAMSSHSKKSIKQIKGSRQSFRRLNTSTYTASNFSNSKKKNNKWYEIRMNIEKNVQNLKNPELFYMDYFKNVMDKEKEIWHEQMLMKRWHNTEQMFKNTKC